MISFLRRIFVDSRLGRVIAFLLFLAFVGWGMGDVFGSFSGGGSPDTVATVGGRKVTAEQVAGALRNQLPQTAQRMGLPDASQLPEGARAQTAREVVQQFVMQDELLVAAAHAGMRAPDDVVRDEVFSFPFFKGADGKFDRALFNQRLARIGMTEREILAQVRDDLTARGLIDGIGATAAAPSGMIDRLIQFNTQAHHLDLVKVAVDQMPDPGQPTDAQARRYYALHPWEFRTTEYRHAKIVALTQDSVGKSIEVPDTELHRIYDFQSRRFHVPETRSLQVATMSTQARAEAVADAWRKGASWENIETLAHDGATVDFPHARQSDIPTPELADAAFKAQANTIGGPVKSETGWLVFKVTDIAAPHDTSFDDAKAGIRDEIVKHEAPTLLHSRAQGFEDAVAGSNTLDAIPANLGAVAAAGALDSDGNTHDGSPAPIPGDAALRQAIVARIFSQGLHARPSVVQGPDNAAFAVYVDEIAPGAPIPFDAARAQVVSAWQAAQRRDAADRRATTLLRAARQGHLVEVASTGDSTGLTITHDVVVSRMRPDATLPQDVLAAAFGLGKGKARMVEADGTFYVLVVTGYSDLSAADAAPIRQQIATSLGQAAQSDVSAAYVSGLEKTTRPDINMRALDEVIRQSNSASSGAPAQ